MKGDVYMLLTSIGLLLGCVFGILLFLVVIIIRKHLPIWGIYLMIFIGGLVFTGCGIMFLSVSFFLT